jgi:murein DD-endopeptidase MepM/ murein hydrolase activator NlpD
MYFLFAAMRRLTLLIFLLLASCAPAQTAVPALEAVPTHTDTPPTAAFFPSQTPLPTARLDIPTSTSIPCDPFVEDFCVSTGNFIFQRPIRPPGNASVDISYRYGTTAQRTRDPHHGVEFQNGFGAPVHAAGDGEIVFAGLDDEVVFSPWRIFYGNTVVIRHADEFYTLYAHLSIIDVAVGQQVRAGDKIGEVGQTGGATGSHLHFEVRRGGDGTDYFSTENPELWLVPQEGFGVLSITLDTGRTEKFEREVVVTGMMSGSVHYVNTYSKGFEHNSEDAVIGNVLPGRYRIAFIEGGVFYERWVDVHAGMLTQVVFALDR